MSVPRNSGKLRCESCNKERRREKAREWYTGHIREARVRANRRQAEKRVADPRLRMFAAAKSRARQKGLEFSLALEDIVIPPVCPILGTVFELKTYYTPSLDRIDPSKGYTKDNIQVMSHKANAMKNSATNEELLKFANWVFTSLSREPKVPLVVGEVLDD